MTRSVARTGGAVCLAMCAAGGWLFAARQQRPTFRAGANFVTVDVYPRQDGHVVEGLKAEDFDVFEDGKPQKIDQFDFVRIEPGQAAAEDRRDPNTQEEGNDLAADPHNRVFVAYLDTYHVNGDGARRMRTPLIGFLNRLLAPNDLFGVMTPQLRPSDLTFGRKTLSIEDELTRHWGWGQQAMSMQDTALEPEEAAIRQCYGTSGTSSDQAFKSYVDRRREDLVLTSLEGLTRHLGAVREARKTVIVFTRGWAIFRPDAGTLNAIRAGQGPAIPTLRGGPEGRLTAGGSSAGMPDRSACDRELSRVFALDDQERFRHLMDVARQLNVTFDMVNPAGLEAADVMGVNTTPTGALATLRDRADSMRTLADNTDGVTIIENNDLGVGLRRLADDLSAYYLLGYYSTNPKFDGKFRQIDVKVRAPGVKVQARRGYLAPKASDMNPPATAAPSDPAATASAALVSDAFGVLARLRPSSELFTYGVAASGELQLVVEIASAPMEVGKWARGGDVEAVITGSNGEAIGTSRGRIEPGTRSALLKAAIPPGVGGPWRASVTVKGADDSLDDRTEVRSLPATLLGAALVFRATPAARSPLRAVADFQFRRTERVHVEWPILKALDRREARVLGRNGQPLAVAAALTERESAPGTFSLAADVNLAPLAEGDYVIEVVAGSGPQTERKLVAFRVVR